MDTFKPMSAWISYIQPDLQELNHPFVAESKIKVLVRREDQNHAYVSGNKWWKLKYNLLSAIEMGYSTVVTFGGAYSNHIYSTAAACRELGLKSIGIIRGEKILPLNSTLAFAEQAGMQLEFISRGEYKTKSDLSFTNALQKKFGKCFIIPEGGTNELAVRGCEELGRQLLQHNFDYLCLPVGTGGTMAGIINAFEGTRNIIGIPVLKEGNFLTDIIKNLTSKEFTNWKLLLDYHHGGYAKTNEALNLFIEGMSKLGLKTEYVYSGKLIWAVFDLIKKGFFEPDSTVLVLHTGGLRTTT